MKIRSKKGFTLVEIMIVVVIIGLLAAMGIPAFAKVRRNSISKAMANDGRQIGAAMVQIATEYPRETDGTTYTFTVVQADGLITGPDIDTGNGVARIQEFVSRIGRSTAVTPYSFTVAQPGDEAFTMSHPLVIPAEMRPGSTVNTSTAPGAAVSFDSEGKVR